MQENGKRLLLAVVLALAVMLVWQKFFAGDSTTPTPPTPALAATGPAPNTAPVENAEIVRCKGEKLDTFTYPSYVVTFSSCGGSLVGWHLTDSRYDQDPAGKGDLVRKAESRAGNDPGDLQVNLRTLEPGTPPIIPPGLEWVGERLPDGMKYTLDYQDIHLTKTIQVYPTSYMLKMTFSGKTGRKDVLKPVVTVYGWQDPKTDTSSGGRVQPRVWQSSSYADGDRKETSDLDIGGEKGESRSAINVRWTGFEHPYLMTAFAFDPKTEPDVSKHTWADSTGLMRTQIELGTTSGGELPAHTVVGFLGPKNFDVLENADSVANFETDFKETVDFGHLPWIGISLSLIGKPLLWMLGKIFSVIGNWGVSIILLTVLVKFVTLYWTTRSMRSMKAMAAVSPEVTALQKKYGDDKQKAQMETMALYKQHGIRPLAGCAPMFLQIPIWSALYIMLSATGELYQQAFIPGWIDDLTNTDPYHILPVALFAMMFLQARLTPQNAAQPGAKMMQYGMPLMFGVMSFYFPSGLTLYIFTNTCLSSLHSLYMNKFDKKSMELTALLKKNKAAVEARTKAEEEAAEAAKLAPKSASKKSKNRPTLKVVDAESVETKSSKETSEEDIPDVDDNDDADEPIEAAATTGQDRPRPRRKKRRR